jgi:hypothetical protein
VSLSIRNPEVEKAIRELARLKRQSLTKAVGEALEAALAVERSKPQDLASNPTSTATPARRR